MPTEYATGLHELTPSCPLLDQVGGSCPSIMDGMDKSKFRFPRSGIFNSKEFTQCVRPCLDMTLAIVHGVGLTFTLSEPYTKKDSSWSIDVLANALHLASASIDLRQADVSLQADNTSRECKNNGMARFCGLMTGGHRVFRMEMRFLQSGHSHEDVDAQFSVISNLIESKKLLESPDQFCTMLEEWLRDAKNRPDEMQFRVAQLADTIRDWFLASCHSQLKFRWPK